MIALKTGVRLHGIRPELIVAILAAEGLWAAQGVPLVITACIEGTHVEASDHYSGTAVDVRTKNLPAGKATDVTQQLQAALGEDFYILLEFVGGANEHCHISWRPKAPY